MVKGVIIFVLAVTCIERTSGLLFTDIDLNEVLDSLIERLGLTYPGTNWCGPGEIADDYDDLGPAADIDTCCRAHDNYPVYLNSLETRDNFTNNVLYKRLHCDGDNEFRECLHAADTAASRTIGVVYFNLLFLKCYREDYPVIGCNRRGGLFYSKCLEPEYDTTGEIRYQWFDVPNY